MVSSRGNRLSSPLMHAFRAAHDKKDAKVRVDLGVDAGEGLTAARRLTARSPISESGLQREVLLDLAGLLNTTNLDAAEDLSDLPAVRASILNYGFPDLSSRTIDESSLHDIARELEVTLSDFEPRLARHSIQARRDMSVGAEELKLRFVVKADLRARPVNVPVEFVAEVDMDSGKIRIDRL